MEKKICPSSNPQLINHNWSMWANFDPMIAGSEVVLGFSYGSSCQNLGCNVQRFAKDVVAVDVVVGIVKRNKDGTDDFNGTMKEIVPEGEAK